MMRLARLVALVSLGLVAVAADAAVTVRDPTDKWLLDYGATSCTAQHDYAGKGAPVTLAFRPSPNGTVVRFIFARPGTTVGAYHFELTVEIGGRRFDTTGLHFTPRGSKYNLVWINLRRRDFEDLRQAGAITLRGGPFNDTFPLPNIRALLDGLAKCNDDLRRFWHADDAGRAALAKPATPLKPLDDYFSSDDYPAQDLRQNASGRSKVMLMIDDTGTPKDCLVEETSGIATLDAQTCAVLLARAKFAPALDVNGKPVRSVFTQEVRWVASR